MKKEALVERKKQKLDVEEGKNDMQSRFLHMDSTEQKTAYDEALRPVEEPNKLEMEIEGSKGKMVNSTLEEQIENIFDELEAKIKREKDAALRKVRKLVSEQQVEQSKGTLKVMKHLDNEDDPGAS
ncbi:uncharacterized protein LOC143602954 isoform X2 [Bidens hawaiensis]|uniref:uncharacterized protein LOC143602954 isoform X2 n=1 Tax=Bidens hawaiensis TaxID=980011 RepID=UPI00404A577F